jgi:serine/threonine protein kinase
LIGEGNFGAVYKGLCRGAQVAVKIPKFSDLTEDKVEAFREELKVMARIVHPRVVALLGAFIPRDFKRNELKIVMELFGRDDIEKVRRLFFCLFLGFF